MTQAQFKIMMSSGLRARLAREAERHGISAAEEIRRRLEQSFEVDYLNALDVARALRTLIKFYGDATEGQ